MSFLINPYRFAPAVPWTPANITTALWLDASDASTVTTANGAVSEWRDKSGNARHATNATTATQPAHTSGSVVFTSDRLNLPAAAWPTDGYSIIAVMQGSTTGSGGTGLINIQSSPADDPEVRIADDTAVYDYFNGGYALTTSTSTLSSKGILCIERSAGVKSELFANGSSVTSGTRAGTLSSTSTFTLGFYPTTNAYRNGTIWRLIVYPTSTDNRQRIEGWMAHEEGLTGLLPAGHPYKSAAPTI